MENQDFSLENHLRELRKQKKISQEELAKALGLSRQSVIAIEQGRSIPSLPVAISLCRFFESSFDELFRISEEIEREFDEMLNNESEKDNNIKLKVINNMPQLNVDEIPLLDGAGKETKMTNELEPWRPFREMVSLRDAMDRLFEDSVITPKSAGMPKIDIKEKKDSVQVKAELPGLTEDEIDVEIGDGIMTISGEKKEEKEENEEGYYYKESHSGVFSRSFALPSDVIAEKADADMEKGVLTITIPKVAEKKAKKIKVKAKKK